MIIKLKVMVIWFGIIKMRNILDNGRIIIKMVLGFMFGMNLKENKNFLEIDMLDNGLMVLEKVMENFIILMVVFMKVIGKIIKKKVLVF